MARINLWQVMPKSKQFAKDWRVHIHGDADLAASFRKRIKFVECSISDPNQWMFCGTFCNKKTALNSINCTLHRYSYPKLQFNAIEDEFFSKRGNNTGLNSNLKSDVGSVDDNAKHTNTNKKVSTSTTTSESLRDSSVVSNDSDLTESEVNDVFR